jgi:GH35 family endo-1,4-beta-xylanase
MRRHLTFVLVLLGLLAPLFAFPAATGAAPSPAVTPGRFVYGANVRAYYTDRNRAFGLLKSAFETNNVTGGPAWIRQQVPWRDHMMRNGTIAWGELDRIVQDAAAKHVKVLLSIAKSPEWATGNGGTGLPSRANFGLFAKFVGGVAARYRGRVHAIQIWNEQNYAVENGGRVAPASYYVDLLGVAYDAIKAADPNIVVVAGAPTPTGTNSVTVAISDLVYFQQMFAIPKFWSKMDVVGVHAAGTLQPPDALPGRGARGEGWNSNTEFFFRRIENVRSLMVGSRQAGRQMWITEFGWATRNNTRGYEYGNYNSPELQAQYLTRALQIIRTSYAPWIGGAFVWNLNYAVTWREAGNPLHEQASFGLLNPDWSPRPSFRAIQALRKY